MLVTGGAGYIGTHTVIEPMAVGHEVFVIDNYANSSPLALKRVKEITGKEIPFAEVDIRDRDGLERVVKDTGFDCCIHFAGLKAVGESVQLPWEYYDNNINGTLVLMDVLRKNGCKNMILVLLQQFMAIPRSSRLRKRVQRDSVPFHMDRPSLCLNRS